MSGKHATCFERPAIPLIRHVSDRAIGVATNSTEEVGRIYMKAISDYKPEFEPTSYLGDGAEAFANASKFVFLTINKRLMCFAHVYKASRVVVQFGFEFSFQLKKIKN